MAQTLVHQLGAVPVALLGDAMERLSLMDAGIALRGGRLPMAGVAVTVDLHPGDNLAAHAGLRRARPGDVLVVAAGGDVRCGLFGELMLREAARRGVAGVVVDGAVRDLEYLTGQPVPVFSRAVSPTGAWKTAPGRVNWPVAAGGVAVLPGDVIVGDADGVAVVPGAMAGLVLERARARAAAEEAVRTALAEGSALSDALGITAQLDPEGGP